MRKHKQTASYDCKTFADNLQIAFSINTSLLMISAYILNVSVSAASIHSLQRTIRALTEGVHHSCAVISFQWQKHTNEECKVHIHNKELLARMRLHNADMQVCEHFSKSERGHARRSTVGGGRQPIKGHTQYFHRLSLEDCPSSNLLSLSLSTCCKPE